jgi:hypothetical protein
MEKQQEILFSIVSENNRNRSLSHPPYQQHQQMPMSSIISQIEPVIKVNMDGRLGSPSNSAFKPSSFHQEATATTAVATPPLVNKTNGVGAQMGLANENLNSMSQMQLCQKLNCIIRNMQ